MTPPPRRRPPLDHEPEAVEYAIRNAGLTHRQLAEMCGVSKSLITEIANGTRNATPAMLNRLASALNCPRVILERKRYEPETAPPAAGQVRGLRTDERTDTDDVPELRSSALTDGAA